MITEKCSFFFLPFQKRKWKSTLCELLLPGQLFVSFCGCSKFSHPKTFFKMFFTLCEKFQNFRSFQGSFLLRCNFFLVQSCSWPCWLCFEHNQRNIGKPKVTFDVSGKFKPRPENARICWELLSFFCHLQGKLWSWKEQQKSFTDAIHKRKYAHSWSLVQDLQVVKNILNSNLELKHAQLFFPFWLLCSLPYLCTLATPPHIPRSTITWSRFWTG